MEIINNKNKTRYFSVSKNKYIYTKLVNSSTDFIEFNFSSIELSIIPSHPLIIRNSDYNIYYTKI